MKSPKNATASAAKRKLTVRRETLKELAPVLLGQAVGGVPKPSRSCCLYTSVY